MEAALFAGVPVSDFDQAIAWFEALLGEPATFEAHETESVWDLAENRSMYVVLRPECAGHALVTAFFLDPHDLDVFVEAAASRGIQPTTRETYGNGVRKVTYHDPDGNEIGFGCMPVDDAEGDAGAQSSTRHARHHGEPPSPVDRSIDQRSPTP